MILFSLSVSLYMTIDASASEPQREPILRIETSNHTGMISQLFVDENRNRIVTTSSDKTLRVWHWPTGRLLDTYRVPIGQGHEGRLSGLALKPNSNIVAVTGWTGWEWDKKVSIYFFDLNSGDLIHRLTDLPNTVTNLTYSPDGKQLVIALSRNWGIRVFDTDTYQLIAEDQDYADDSIGIHFNHNTGEMVTSSLDGHIRKYDRNFNRLLKTSIATGKQPVAIRYSPDFSKIALGFLDVGRIVLLSPDNLSILHEPDLSGVSNQKTLTRVAWENDGSRLYAYGLYTGQGKTPVYAWSNGGLGSMQRIPIARKYVTALDPVEQGGFVYGTNDPVLGRVNAQGRQTTFTNISLADFREMEDKFRVSSDGSIVQFAYQRNGQRLARFSQPKRDLLTNVNNDSSLKAPVVRTVGIDLTNWRQSETPLLNGQLLTLEPHETAHSVSVHPDKQSFVLGSSWGLINFSRNGQELWRTPLTSEALAVNTTADGKLAVAALGDGTIRWYRIKDGEEVSALFAHNNGVDWILWIPDGYYTSSPNGDRYIGWHVNRGKDKAADFYLAVQFDRILFRPDVVKSYFSALGDSKILSAILGVGRFIISQLARIAPPKIHIQSTQAQVSSSGPGRLKLRFSAEKNSLPMKYYAVYINNIPVTPSRERHLQGSERDAFVRQVTLPMLAKENNIRIEISNGSSIGLEERFVSAPAMHAQNIPKGNLYILATGVNEFNRLQVGSNLKYAARDANEFARFFRSSGKKHYKQVFVRLLTDNTATKPEKDHIIKALDFIKDTRAEDTVILFLASHGISDKAGDYYFVPSDAAQKDVDQVISGKAEKGNSLVSWKVFFDALGQVAGRRLLVVDTCQAAGIEGTFDLHSLAKRSASSSFSLLVASRGNEKSQEYDPARHGLFTYALLQGLRGKADNNRDQTITLNELYQFTVPLVAKKRNKALGFQHPVLQAPEPLGDMSLVSLK